MRRVTLLWALGLLLALLSLLAQLSQADGGGPSMTERVIWAVNAGGETHTDVHGVHFRKDPLEGKVGKASDYGMRLPILRSTPEDQVLYQTERYSEDTFGYEVPIRDEGDYILVLKFAEVYFAQSQQKVFDIRLNGHMVVKDLDIFDRVGHSTAHDEFVPFSIRRGKLSVRDEVSTFNGKLTVEFVKMYLSSSLTLDWRSVRKRKRKRRTRERLRRKWVSGAPLRCPRTGSARGPGRPIHTRPTTAASCSPSWWRLESSSPPSSASAGSDGAREGPWGSTGDTAEDGDRLRQNDRCTDPGDASRDGGWGWGGGWRSVEAAGGAAEGDSQRTTPEGGWWCRQ
uniref:Malectin n=1 Tax=Paramormyrops kingsleyae TaxID=1676925 RepID=A0A3B3QQL4_9TELE